MDLLQSVYIYVYNIYAILNNTGHLNRIS